jgi:hypothetical protein
MEGIMKSSLILLLACLVLQPIITVACPTCVGRIYMDKKKKPFFAKDFYQPKSKPAQAQKKSEESQSKQETAQRTPSPFDELWSES